MKLNLITKNSSLELITHLNLDSNQYQNLNQHLHLVSKIQGREYEEEKN